MQKLLRRTALATLKGGALLFIVVGVRNKAPTRTV